MRPPTRCSAATWAAVVLSGCASPCAAGPPPEFDRFRADLAADAPLRMTLLWPDPRLPTQIPVTVVIGPDGASASASMGTVETDGSRVTFGDGELKIPLVDVGDEAADLFGELRSGLEGSTWRTIDAPVLGPTRPAPDAAWAEVTLPFDWASGERGLLAVDRTSGQLRYLVLETDQPPLTVSARPPRGGARTVELADGALLALPVRDYTRP